MWLTLLSCLIMTHRKICQLRGVLFFNFLRLLNSYISWAHLLGGRLNQYQFLCQLPCQDLVMEDNQGQVSLILGWLRVCDAFFSSSMDDMQNFAPPATAAPHIPLTPSFRKIISISGPVSPLSASSLARELFTINYSLALVHTTNDISEGDSVTFLNKN